MTRPGAVDVRDRIDALDWNAIEASLWERGYARTAPLITGPECDALMALYADDGLFRSRVDMERYRFGVGDYKYFDRPLPPLVDSLRIETYERLAPIANRWETALRSSTRYPERLSGLAEQCARHGQTKPTPLLLHYEAGGYNCLHQDLYGVVAFPLQMTVFLSRRRVDYDGGEFLLLEQRPRAQARVEVLPTEQGESVIFTTRSRPVPGARGHYRATMKHGVARIVRGTRMTLGIIFHDAK